MASIAEHKGAVKDLIDDINEKIRVGIIVPRQKIIGFAASEAAANMFAILLHKNALISPGFNVNHRFFTSDQIARKTFDFDFPHKDELLELLVKQEDFRNKLCYGRAKNETIVTATISNFFKLKNIIEAVLGEEI